MKNLIEYVFTCTNAMFKFKKGQINLDLLIVELKKCENHYKDINNIPNDDPRKLWFKFGEDDTLATTILNLKNDLSLPKGHGNHKFRIQQFDIVFMDIDPKNELRVYFS